MLISYAYKGAADFREDSANSLVTGVFIFYFLLFYNTRRVALRMPNLDPFQFLSGILAAPLELNVLYLGRKL